MPPVIIHRIEVSHYYWHGGFEGFGLLMERGCITVADDGRLQTIPEKVRKSVTGTDETKSCQRVARILGKEFARIADRVTVYTSLGIRP